MSLDIDELLDEVDRWKFSVQEQLKNLSATQRSAFWAKMGQRARRMGMRVVESKKPDMRATKREHRTG